MHAVHRSRRRGQAAIWAGSLLTLLGFAAIVVDLGYARSNDAQLDAVAEAAAMSGAGYLDGTDEGVLAAVQGAKDVAAANKVQGTAVILEDADVVTGIWDADAKLFTPESEDETVINAVQVNARRDDIATFFSNVTWGVSTLSVAGTSTVQRGDIVGAGGVDCFLPLAVPDCYFDQTEDDVENMILKFNPANADSIGWGRMNAEWDNTYNKAQLEDMCADEPAYIGDQVYLGNGISSSTKTIDDVLEASSTTWDSDKYGTQPPAITTPQSSTLENWGNTLEGPFILFDDDSYCTDADGDGKFDGGSFNGNKTTTGFGWAVIFDVVDKGAADERNIQMHIDLTGEHHIGSIGGGDNYNLTFIGNSKEVQ